MVTDALTRSLSSNEGDLQFAQTQLENSLKDLREDIQSSKGELSFEVEKDLKNLEKSLPGRPREYKTEFSICR